MGRMGFPMAERLLKAGHDVSIWNRTRAKAEPLAKSGGKMSTKLSDLADCDVVFRSSPPGRTSKRSISVRTAWCMAATASCRACFVDCSTIALEESAAIRAKLKALGSDSSPAR